jgi:hypothetical protein
MAQKVVFKVTAVTAKVKEHNTNLEKITGEEGRTCCLLDNIITH